MIQNVTITNHLGESITIEMRFPEKSGFLIRDIEGLGPSKADINITEVPAIDGAAFNSSRVNSRNIIFSLGFLEKPTIEDVRQKSYKYFPIKKPIKIRIETDKRICEAIGYVESNDVDIFSKSSGTTISVICPDSYFYSVDKNETLFSYLEPLFEFPFSNESLTEKLIILSNLEINTTRSVLYEGDASVGVTIFIHAVGAASNVEIFNVMTLETISINSDLLLLLTGSDIKEGDDIVICTEKGNKYAHLIRDGITTNILNCLNAHPNWFQLEKGDNLFAYTADLGISNLQFRIENRIAYEGV